MALLLTFFFIGVFLVEDISSQDSTLILASGGEYKYQISSDSIAALTEPAFAFNNEVACLLNTYQGSLAQPCRTDATVQSARARTNTLLSETLKTDVPKIKDADTKAASSIALCNGESTCVYLRQLESYYLMMNLRETLVLQIKSLKRDGLRNIKNEMDYCVRE